MLKTLLDLGSQPIHKWNECLLQKLKGGSKVIVRPSLHHNHRWRVRDHQCGQQGLDHESCTSRSPNTKLAFPQHVHTVPLHEANSIYLGRTYAYVAGGKVGLVILDITNPELAFIDQIYNAGGQIDDAQDVKLGITNVSQFAYDADGKNGLRVLQLTSPELPWNDGFSPRPNPCLIATRKLPKNGHALCVSRGVDRDRAVDESGNQIAVFGRVGARPLSRISRN